MKIDLITPCLKDPGKGLTAFAFPPLGLGLLAAITPADTDVSITDDLVQPVDFDTEADLVGITVSTKTAVRAYEIADEFRRRSVPVVLGGIHPTVAPQEAIQHADAIVVGEAEGVWKQLLDDCKSSKLKRIYHSDKFPLLDNSPHPRRELFQRDKYFTINGIQTSRGCPFSCDFCSVTTIYGSNVRLRPVDDVVGEIKTLKGNNIFFIDDNIVGRPEYAKQLFTRLIPLKKKWFGQASVTVANDEEILKLLRESGCLGLFMGFETTTLESLKEIGKNQNVGNNYFETVKKLHDNGVSIVASFIIGLDNDDKSCFERLLNFSVKSKIDVADFHLVTPYPGTVLYKRLKEEKRLIDNEWWLKYDVSDVVFRPKLMSREELRQGWRWTAKEFYKLRPTLKRCIGGLGKRTLLGNFLNWKVNMGYRLGAYSLSE
jgi:radical SAM superfamily enzyme YgiQ (UPF0313 family)